MNRFAGYMVIGLVILATGAGAGMFLPGVLPITAGEASLGAPNQINHQGVVAVNGVRFTGSGQFYFAVLDGGTGVNVWTNDGSQIGTTNRPDTAVTLAVGDGLYSVRLGDVSLANMTTLDGTVFGDSDRKLRVWFNDGSSGVAQLSPDHVLTSNPYAFVAALAAEVPDGSVTIGKLAFDVAGADGWIAASETWTYASATTCTVSGDVTSKYAAGDKVRLKQGGGYKYFYVVSVTYSSPNSTITLTGGSDHSLANAAITENGYSKAETPQGFPGSFNYVTTIGAVAPMNIVSATGTSATFRMTGKTVHVKIGSLIAKNGTPSYAVTATLPLPAGGGSVGIGSADNLFPFATNVNAGSSTMELRANAYTFAVDSIGRGHRWELVYPIN